VRVSVDRGYRPSVAAAYALFVLVGVSAGVGGVLLPAQISDYAVDKATIGLTFFTFSAGFMAAGATVGGLVHRLGIANAIAVGGAAFTLAAVYTGTRPPFVALVVVQVVVGYGIGVLESVLNAYLSELPNPATLLNRLHGFFGVGALIGPALAAWMLRSTRWTAVWIVLAVASAVLVAAFLVVSRQVTEAKRAPQAAKPPKGLLLDSLRSRGVVFGALFLAGYVGLEISLGNWGFSFLVGHFNQAELLAGYTISGFWLGLTVGRFVISPLGSRVGVSSSATSFGCLVGVALSALLIWASPISAIAAVGFVLLGFFLAPLFPTAMAMAPRLTDKRLVATAIGVMNGASVIGGSFFSWLSGAIAQGAGVWTLMPFALALALLLLVLWQRLVAGLAVSAPSQAAELV
jgi:fucose permease